MAKVMKHPWVTKRGQWPLKAVREMIKDGGKIDEDEPELPDLMSTFNVLDVPRQVHVREHHTRQKGRLWQILFTARYSIIELPFCAHL